MVGETLDRVAAGGGGVHVEAFGAERAAEDRAELSVVLAETHADAFHAPIMQPQGLGQEHTFRLCSGESQTSRSSSTTGCRDARSVRAPATATAPAVSAAIAPR